MTRKRHIAGSLIAGLIAAALAYLAMSVYDLITYDPTYTSFPRSAAWFFAAISPVCWAIYGTAYIIGFAFRYWRASRLSSQCNLADA
jgi:hypothetical protein